MYWPNRAFDFNFAGSETLFEISSRHVILGGRLPCRKAFQGFHDDVSDALVGLLHRKEACVPKGTTFRYSPANYQTSWSVRL
jgi:hypothetical protein